MLSLELQGKIDSVLKASFFYLVLRKVAVFDQETGKVTDTNDLQGLGYVCMTFANAQGHSNNSSSTMLQTILIGRENN
jgi:hypothetical protein